MPFLHFLLVASKAGAYLNEALGRLLVVVWSNVFDPHEVTYTQC